MKNKKLLIAISIILTLFFSFYGCKKEIDIVPNNKTDVDKIYNILENSKASGILTKNEILNEISKSKYVKQTPYLDFNSSDHNCGTIHTDEAELITFSRSDLQIPNEIIIPVVFHVIHSDGVGNISTEQILSGLDRLNSDFSETNFSFCLATQDPEGNPSTGIVRINGKDFFPDYTSINSLTTNSCSFSVYDNDLKDLSLWSKSHAMSVYIVPQINCSNGTFGYATTPNGLSFGSVYDAIVIRYDRIGSVPLEFNGVTYYDEIAGGTFTHEVGHWLGLRHPWGATTNPNLDCENLIESPFATCGGTTVLDFVCDTPPTKGPRSPNCNLGQACAQALIGNYMDYDIQCYNHFTPGQIQRMYESMFLPSRIQLLNSNGSACNSSTCLWDLDGDNIVGVNDLLILLSQWGSPYTSGDLLNFLSEFGTSCV
jgi:hypothetical protein